MSHNYDNWERLVEAVFKREELRRTALLDESRESSVDYSMLSSPSLQRFALLDDSREPSFNSIPSPGFNFGSSSNTVVNNRDSDIFQQFDATVEILLESLKQLLLSNASMTLDVKSQVEFMCYDLRLFKAFVKDSNEKRNNDATLQELVKQIIDVFYNAEDTVDAIVAQAAVNKSRSSIQRGSHVFDYHAKLRSVGKNFEVMRAKVNDIYMNKKFGFEAPKMRTV
ncbi:Hypothetical predicted protein [Olea europaea subsp. europaea]|uniref:Disease resistance N-terminal domain-containing protein n=1 Tax=Olea europaea subsp. europaea TaxID=158383 RepID=A0A8S0TZE8_OLEEU|nr:Hypothetical predicted protein [Olea europaea subsp. europaea]